MKFRSFFSILLFQSIIYGYLNAGYLTFNDKKLATDETLFILRSVNIIPQQYFQDLNVKHLFNITLTLLSYGCFKRYQNGETSLFSSLLTYEQAKSLIEKFYLHIQNKKFLKLIRGLDFGNIRAVEYHQYIKTVTEFDWKRDKRFGDFYSLVGQLGSEDEAFISYALLLWRWVSCEVLKKAQRFVKSNPNQRYVEIFNNIENY